MWLHKRSSPKSLMNIWFIKVNLGGAKGLLDEANISYVQKDEKLRLTVDAQMIQANVSLLQKVAERAKDSWGK